MVRKLLATTALAGVLATGAFAQDATTPAPETPPAASGETPAGEMAPGAMPADNAATVASIEYLQSLGTDQYLASDLDGGTVYASNAADAESAGEIQNFVVDADGTVAAVVVETANLEENKTVAVPFDQVEWTMDASNGQRAVLTATPEQLTAAPTFTAPDETTAATDPTGAMAPAGGAGGTMPPAATGTDTAMAPAADPAMAPAAGTDTAMAPATGDMAAAESGGFLATVGAEQYLSADLIGEEIYSGPGDDADNIGSVNDLVMNADGSVEAFVVGVGGFLGIGEKDVGVPFDQISLMSEADGEPRSVLAATREQLTEAPAFEGGDDQMAAGTTAPAAGGMAAGTTDMAATGSGLAGTGAAAVGAAGTAAVGAAGTTAGEAADATTTASTGGAQDMSSLSPVTGAELSADDLMGTDVYGPDNQTIGSVADIAMTAEGQVDAVIVDVGGFLGIGAKPVAIAMDNVQFMQDSTGSTTLTTQFTQEQLENAPEYDSETYAENRDSMLVESAGDIPAAAEPAATAPAPAQ